MTSWALLENGSMERGPAPSSSHGVQIGPSSTANTKTAYTQLIASTTYETSVLILCFRASSHIQDMLFDIAIGGAGSEQIIVPNIYIYGGGNGLSFHFWIPVWIPSGKRIAARMQGSDTLVNAFVTCYALSASMFGEFGFQIIDSLGTSTANSGGTAIDAGAVANTKGSYAQIIASTSAAYRGLIVMFGNNATNRSLVADYAVDIAIGAAASERVILPDLELKANGQDQVIPQVWGPFFFNIPSGVRLSARSSSTTTDAVERIIDVAILGLR